MTARDVTAHAPEELVQATGHENDVAVVSWNANGFWQADLFEGWRGASWQDWEDGPAPDDFFTLSRAFGTEDDAKRRAAEKWPGCQVIVLAQADEDEDDDDDNHDCGEDTCVCPGRGG